MSLAFRFFLFVLVCLIFEIESCYAPLELTMLPMELTRLAMSSRQSSYLSFFSSKIYKLVPPCLGISDLNGSFFSLMTLVISR